MLIEVLDLPPPRSPPPPTLAGDNSNSVGISRHYSNAQVILSWQKACSRNYPAGGLTKTTNVAIAVSAGVCKWR